jgi:hypothetical protein
MGCARGAIAALIVACAATCGPPPAVKPPAPPPLEVRHYKPLAFKADATAPQHAVLLGTDATDGSTILPLAVATPAPDGSRAWRASVWTAALVAATTLDKDLGDLHLPDPAAGTAESDTSAHVAAAFIAAAVGAPVDPSTIVLGTVNPDGTLAPIANPLERVRTAIAKGARRIAVPAGQLAEIKLLATQSHVEAVEVEDVHGAYAALTGKPLPAPVPVTAAEMALDDTTATALDARYKQWQQRLAVEWGAILQLESAGRLPQLLSYLRDTSKTLAQSADALHKKKLVGAAYARMFAAALYASTANQAYDILAKVQANRIDDAIALLARHDTVADVTRAVLTKIGTVQPTSLGAHLQMLASFRAALRGWVFEAFATQAVATTKSQLKLLAGKSTAELGSDQTAEAVVSSVVPTLLYVGKTIGETSLAAEQLELRGTTEVDYRADVTRVRTMSASFEQAAAAGMRQVDALLVTPVAERHKLREEDARRQVALGEPDYLVGFTLARASTAESVITQLQQTWGVSSLAAVLLSIAANELAYTTASELLTRYDALHVDLTSDGSGRVTTIEHADAFARMLAAAERTARANARAARIASGSIPVQAKLAYENATVDRAGTLGDQLDALSQFWASSAYSQLAVMLARSSD